MDEDKLLERLSDIEEIKQLKARFFWALDHQDWGAYGQAFASDAHLEVPEANVSEHGREAIVASVSGALAGARTVHHGHMPEIEVTGPGMARGVWAMFDYVELPPDEGGHSRGLQGYGHYTEEYVREDGEWRIKHLHLSRLRIDPLTPPE
jgi:uncharacterized protein (TIGR02246 family)